MFRFCFVLTLLQLVATGFSQEAQKTDTEEKAQPKAPLEEMVSETNHSIRAGGIQIDYTARAGTLVMRDEENKPKASVFYVAYKREGIEDTSERPITFSFNGGPGSSSVWLHLGAFGPKRVLLDAEGHPLPPPSVLVDNEYTLLDLTDLVFIDPVTTGFSRASICP